MTPVILMTAQASLQTAIRRSTRAPSTTSRSRSATTSWSRSSAAPCEYRAVRVENKQLKQEIRRRDKSGRQPGRSASRSGSWSVLRLAENVAPTDSTVLIQGESGTGKEVVARYIHDLSSRTDGPVPLHQLRRAAREPARERAVRAREGLVHRRGAGQAGPVRGGAGRELLPRRGRRDAAVAPGEAPARAPGAGGDPGRRHRGDPGRRPDHRGDQPRPRGGDPPRATSAPTSSTGSTSSRSTCRRCASGATTSRCWSRPSSRRLGARGGQRAQGARLRTRSTRSWCTSGRATCASWRTRWSAPWS